MSVLMTDGPSGHGPSLPPFQLQPATVAGPASVGDAVYDQVLLALHEGRLRPGQPLRDNELAAQLGVSRTPVREALLRLRHLGVVEFAPARYTRVAIVDAEQAANAVVAWVTVYAAVAAGAASSGAPPEVLRAMRDAHERFAAGSDPYELEALAASNADFYDQLTDACPNPQLVRCVESVVHVVRLGLLHLPGPLDARPLHLAQAALLEALSAGDARAARRAVYRVAEIPLAPGSSQG